MKRCSNRGGSVRLVLLCNSGEGTNSVHTYICDNHKKEKKSKLQSPNVYIITFRKSLIQNKILVSDVKRSTGYMSPTLARLRAPIHICHMNLEI